MAKFFSTLLLSLSLTLPAFGQMFDYGDMSWFGVVATPLNFTPTDIPGLVRWFDAQSIVGLNDTDPVATWIDKTGNSDATQGSAAYRPKYVASWADFGNKPGLSLDGDDGLSLVNLADDSKTVLIVCQVTNGTSGTLAYLISTFSSIKFDSDNRWEYLNADTAASGGQAVTSVGVVILRYHSVTSADIRCNAGSWVNFNPHDSYDDVGSMNIGYAAGSSMRGLIGEVLVYDSPLTDADVNRVGVYLAARWNFTWTNL